jgi:type II secretory pathway component PulF
MVSLVKASERIHNLPWVLSELGDNLARRMVCRLLRLSQLFAPISVLAVGVLVGAIVVGMFMPLIRIIARLS